MSLDKRASTDVCTIKKVAIYLFSFPPTTLCNIISKNANLGHLFLFLFPAHFFFLLFHSPGLTHFSSTGAHTVTFCYRENPCLFPYNLIDQIKQRICKFCK